ncbi:BQ2448_7611 [Microbotryum intermedium]|uniref:BQ2448_7611 protein n=1 Tax=Microbotryum intermedium TaxID=269621 RepID=A0A238FLD4_9BASI|nr:BQ2448_7611 [Microbotryum intermedium]
MSPSFPAGGPPPLPPILRHARTSSTNTLTSSSSSSSSTGTGSPTRRSNPFVDGHRSPGDSVQSSTNSSRSADPVYANVGSNTVRMTSRRSSSGSDGRPNVATIAYLPSSGPRDGVLPHSPSYSREHNPLPSSSPGLSRSQSYSAQGSPSSSNLSRQSSPPLTRRGSYRTNRSSPSMQISRAGRISPSASLLIAAEGSAFEGLSLDLMDELLPAGAHLPSPPASLNGAITSSSSTRALSTIRSNEELNHAMYGHRSITSASARTSATEATASTGRPRPDRPPRSEARSAPSTPTAPTTPDKRLSMSSSIPLIKTSSPSVAGTPSRSQDYSNEQRRPPERLNLIEASSKGPNEKRRESVDTISSNEPYLDALGASRSPSPSPPPSPTFLRSSDAPTISTQRPSRQAFLSHNEAIAEARTRALIRLNSSLPFSNPSALGNGPEHGETSSSKQGRHSEGQSRNQRILGNINSSSPRSGLRAADGHARVTCLRPSHSIDDGEEYLTHNGPRRRSSWVGSDRTRAASNQGACSRDGSEATSPSAIASPDFSPRNEWSSPESRAAHTMSGSVSNSTRPGIPPEFLQTGERDHFSHDQQPANTPHLSTSTYSSAHGASTPIGSPSSQSENSAPWIPTRISSHTNLGDDSRSHPQLKQRMETSSDPKVDGVRGQPASTNFIRPSMSSWLEQEGPLPLEERRRRLRNLEVGSSGWISEFQAIRALQAPRTRARAGSEDDSTQIRKGGANLVERNQTSQPVSQTREDFLSAGNRGSLPATSPRKRSPRRSMSRLSLVSSSGDVGASSVRSSMASRNSVAGRPVGGGEQQKLVHAAFEKLQQVLGSISHAQNSQGDALDPSDLLKRIAATVGSTVKLNDRLRDLVQAMDNFDLRADGDDRRRSMDSTDEAAESSILGTAARSLFRTSNDQMRCLTEEIIALTRFERGRHSTSQDEGRSPRSLSRASGYRPSTSLGIMSPARSGDQHSLSALSNATPSLRSSALRTAFSPLSLHSSPESRDRNCSPHMVSQDGRALSRSSGSISRAASIPQYNTSSESSPTVGSQSRRRNLLSNITTASVRPVTPSSMQHSLSRASILSAPVFNPTNASTFESPTSRLRRRRASEVSFPSDTLTLMEAQREPEGDQAAMRDSFESSGTHRGASESLPGQKEGQSESRSASGSPEDKRESRRQEVEAILRRAATGRV